MSAPGSFRSSSPVQSSYYVGFAQKVPWAGKRELRGDKAQAEANALSLDYQDSRLRLAEAARLAFYDFFLVYRNRELNDANRRILEEFRDTARKRYESNLVTRQDVLQAEVELAKLDRRRLELERTERVTRARINTLLHRQPNYPLPPPPRELLVGGEVLDVDVLQHLAIEQRPDLAAQASRLQAEQTSVALACKEFYPDFEFMGRYDAFWTDRVQRGQVGMNMNIPLNQNRRCAAVNEALFRVSKMQAEYNQQVDNIHNDVEASFARVDESRKVVQLYREKILPAAEDNVRAAASEYTAGKVDFLRLIAAQQELIALQENSYEAVTDFFRRRAELERVLASPLPEADSPTEVRPPIGE